MKANPGGVIDPRHVYGRDSLIAELWQRLDQLCVLMNAERRIGKTSVLRKMASDGASRLVPRLARPGEVPFRGRIRGRRLRAGPGLSRHLEENRECRAKIYEDHEFEHFKRTSGRRPWKALLTAAVHDLLAEKQAVRPVFLWDEVPYMIDHIRRADGEQAAVEVLDTLRSLRQEYPGLRMVFSGSIGLHHVLGSIREDKMSSEPVNDMYPVEVPPLATADAVKLAEDLIQGESLSASNSQKSAEVVADEADCFPFYIHHIVAGLRKEGLAAEPDTVRELVGRHLVDANDPWDLGHYRNRIPAYYTEGKNAKLVGLILDALAIAQEPITVLQLRSRD